MTKLSDLNQSIKKIDTNDYNRAISSLGPRPVSQMVYLNQYKPKRERVDAQIIKAKKDVGLVLASVAVIDKRLEDAQTSINNAIKKLEKQEIPGPAMLSAMNGLKNSRRSVSIIRFNITVLKRKLADLGYKIG